MLEDTKMEEGQGNDTEGRPAQKNLKKKKRAGNREVAQVCRGTKKSVCKYEIK